MYSLNEFHDFFSLSFFLNNVATREFESACRANVRFSWLPVCCSELTCSLYSQGNGTPERGGSLLRVTQQLSRALDGWHGTEDDEVV